jgi:hypothetical protein
MSIKINSITYVLPTCNLIGTINYNTNTQSAYINITNLGPNTALNVKVSLTPDYYNELCIIGSSAPSACVSTPYYECVTANIPILSSGCFVNLDIKIRSGVTIYGIIKTDSKDLGSGTFSGSVQCATTYCRPPYYLR